MATDSLSPERPADGPRFGVGDEVVIRGKIVWPASVVPWGTNPCSVKLAGGRTIEVYPSETSPAPPSPDARDAEIAGLRARLRLWEQGDLILWKFEARTPPWATIARTLAIMPIEKAYDELLKANPDARPQASTDAINAALANLRENAMSDDEIEELLK